MGLDASGLGLDAVVRDGVEIPTAFYSRQLQGAEVKSEEALAHLKWSGQEVGVAWVWFKITE